MMELGIAPEKILFFEEYRAIVTKGRKKLYTACTLNRKNNDVESKFIFNLKKSNLNYHLISNNSSLNIPVITKKIISSDNYLLIEYEIENDKFRYEIIFKECI